MYWGDQKEMAGGPVDQAAARGARARRRRKRLQELAATAPRPRWRRWRWLAERRSEPRIDGDTRPFLVTTVHLQVGWRDRLRLLTTGKAEVFVTNYTDVKVSASTCLAFFQVVSGW